ncbi:replication-associated recombination protein A [Fusobacterium massiliense]|jgi:ATPase, AAA family|uniref:replication-associated recombination protein A n=1 Tax=Fusobacterium massiliense TaxID=1852365 RepID=UPI0028D23BF6|nr:replication-associated recombination protein A [Fusobacterium massiliense]
MNLFQGNYKNVEPLAYKLRPKTLDDFVGQEKLLGKDGIIRKLILNSTLSNSIFYGPPGCGKSSLGQIISNTLDCNFEKLNATTASISDIREVVEKARKNIELYGKRTILFLDEIHRFNKTQQDALLSYTEDGTLTLIGATTENPYYNINNALLSRVMIFEFKELSHKDIDKIIKKASDYLKIEVPDKIREIITDISQGDSRITLNYVEMYNNIYSQMTEVEIYNIFKERQLSFDKKQDKYDMISAFIKSVRGSDPDAAVYWLGRLLDGGEDPRYIARRLFIEASEDIGMANSEALLIANAAMNACERIGMPEVRIILSHATIYLAISSKSNSVYNAINTVLKDIKDGNVQEVPINICHDNVGYKYPHDYPDNFIKQKYMNKKKKYYIPGNNKNEKKIAEKLNKIWE